MISDPVKRWKKRLGENTWRVYNSHWTQFLEAMEIVDPKKLLKLSPREAGDLAVDYFTILNKKGYSSKSCSLAYAVIRSFFTHNGIRLEKFGQKFIGHVEYERGYICTQQQVFQLIEAIPKWRNKLAVGICFQGGQRCGICTGLKFHHIDTRNWKKAQVVVFTVPAFLPNVKGKNVNKRNVKYRFAVLDDVARYLVLHVEERERRNEDITPDSWLIKSSQTSHPPNINRINEMVKEAAERIGIQRYTATTLGKKKALIHPHIGRLYFKTQMRLSGVDPELRQFMMGHKMPYGGAYDKFSESELVNAMESARPLLALAPKVISQVEWQKQEWLKNAPSFVKPDELERIGKIIKDSATNC